MYFYGVNPMLLLFIGCLSSSTNKSAVQPADIVKTPLVDSQEKMDRPSEHQPLDSVGVSVYFIDGNDQLVAVNRRGPKQDKAQFALQRLYAGPTETEIQRGLELIKCGTTGATLLSVKDGLATVQLQGQCRRCGALGIYDSIVKTLKQFPQVSYVHVLSPQGNTQRISERTDARPECLEP